MIVSVVSYSVVAMNVVVLLFTSAHFYSNRCVRLACEMLLASLFLYSRKCGAGNYSMGQSPQSNIQRTGEHRRRRRFRVAPEGE